jgi:hypothetical protein
MTIKQALRGVWSALAGVDRELEALGSTPWAAVVPRNVRKSLEALLEQLKTFPARIRQYDAFGHVQRRIKELVKHNIIVTDLHSDALRERHWKLLRTRLNVQWVLSELTLGDIWRADLVRDVEPAMRVCVCIDIDAQTVNGASFRDVITQAQGELALEEFLKTVREHWQAYVLDLVQLRARTCVRATCHVWGAGIRTSANSFAAGTTCSPSSASTSARSRRCAIRRSSRCLKRRHSCGRTSSIAWCARVVYACVRVRVR